MSSIKVSYFLASNWNIIFLFIFILTFVLLIYFKKFNYLLSFISIYITLLALSAYTSFFFISSDDISVAKKQYIEKGIAQVFDFYPASFLQYLDGRGDKNIIKYSENDLEPINFPLSGSPSQETIYCQEDNGLTSFMSDRFGFRNSNELWDAGDIAILLLGDSFAQGACVKNSIQDILNTKYSTRTLSLGQGGNGPLTSFAVNKEFNEVFSASHSYYLIYYNDFSREVGHELAIDFERELANKTLIKTLTDKDYLQDYFIESNLANLSEFYAKLNNSILETTISKNVNTAVNILGLRPLARFAYSISSLRAGDLRFLSPVDSKMFIKTLRAFDAINSMNITFVLLPNKRCLNNNYESAIYLKEQFKLTGIQSTQFLDLSKSSCKEELFAKSGVHFNQLGYETLSHLIFNDFKSRIPNKN